MKSVSFSDNTLISYFEVSPLTSSSLSNETNQDEVKEDLREDIKEDLREDKAKDKVYTKYTKFCLFGLGKCKKGMKCVYAHTFKELNPITCKWNDECLRKEKCYFKHSNETKTEYVKRAFSEDIKRLNICLFEEKHMENMEKMELKKDKNKEEKEHKDEKYSDEYLQLVRNFRAMYYDPIFEVRCWADIPESDEDSYPYF